MPLKFQSFSISAIWGGFLKITSKDKTASTGEFWRRMKPPPKSQICCSGSLKKTTFGPWSHQIGVSLVVTRCQKSNKTNCLSIGALVFKLWRVPYYLLFPFGDTKKIWTWSIKANWTMKLIYVASYKCLWEMVRWLRFAHTHWAHFWKSYPIVHKLHYTSLSKTQQNIQILVH